MNTQKEKWLKRESRQLRVRKEIFGTKERPRLCVYRSLTNIYAQIVDDIEGKTLCAVSTLQKDIKSQLKSGGNKKAAEVAGVKLAELAKGKGIEKVVFDRRHYKYHGRVKAFADAVRKGGLKF